MFLIHANLPNLSNTERMAADNGSEMECPSPDIGDSRKRPLDCDVDNSLTKRSHFSSGQ